MIEIRWHGRGGQGAKTASHLFADAALAAGRWVQTFPEYGPERSGAPVRAYDRLDDRPIRRRSPVTRPDVVVVLDETLIEEDDVTAGLGPEGVLIVNSGADAERLAQRLDLPGRVVAVDGSGIAAERRAGRANVVMLGALAGVLEEPGIPVLESALRRALGGKLGADVLQRASDGMRAGHRAGARSGVRLRRSPSSASAEQDRLLAAPPDSRDLEPFRALRPGAVVAPGERARPVTGTWREGARPEVDLSQCIHCLLCWVYCPDLAIRVEDGHVATIDYEVCKGCELCAEVCPVDAIEMVTEPSTALGRTGGAA